MKVHNTVCCNADWAGSGARLRPTSTELSGQTTMNDPSVRSMRIVPFAIGLITVPSDISPRWRVRRVWVMALSVPATITWSSGVMVMRSMFAKRISTDRSGYSAIEVPSDRRVITASLRAARLPHRS